MSSLARLRVTAVLAAVVTTMATGHGYQSPQTSLPWPPGVQRVPADAPALSPAEALKTFYMPPGYHLELVASEPLIQDPIAIDWDGDGRLWAVEMPGFVPDLAAQEPNIDPIGRIVVLEDTDNDGAMDKRTVFADGLVLAASLEGARSRRARRRAAERLADARHERRSAHGHEGAGHRPNTAGARPESSRTPTISIGGSTTGWIPRTATSSCGSRTASSRCRRRWRAASGASRTTTAGRIYRNTNESALHVDFVPTPYYFRNPNLLRTRGSYEAIRDDDDAINVVWPVRPNPGTNRAYQFGHRSPGRNVWRSSRRSARRWSIGAIDCRRSCTATCSSPSRPRIS